MSQMLMFQLRNHPQIIQKSREYWAGSLENLPKPVLFSPNIGSITIHIWECPKMVVPLVIIHFIFGCSIINHPAIGVPPFKDTPISTSTKPHEGFTLHLRHIAWSHLATTSWRAHCKEPVMEPLRMSSPRGSRIPWRSLLPCSSLHQIEWRRSSLEASGQGCSAWTLHGDKKEWASGAKIHLLMVRIWVIIWRRKSWKVLRNHFLATLRHAAPLHFIRRNGILWSMSKALRVAKLSDFSFKHLAGAKIGGNRRNQKKHSGST